MNSPERDKVVGGGGDSPGLGNDEEPTIEDKRTFAKALYKISKEELGKVITDLDTKCPKALTKNSAEDEVEINVDFISPAVFREVMAFVKRCGGEGSGKDAARKKKTAKRARTS